MSAAAHVFEEIAAPESPEEREAARTLADCIAHGSTSVVLRDADGTEHTLPADELRILLALIVARAQGQKAWVVGGEEQISPQKAAELLGISRPMVYRLIERGDLDATMVGTHQRLRVAQVLDVAQRRAGLAVSVDSGFAKGRHAGRSTPADGDPKASWLAATDDERDAARERSRDRAARRRARS